MQDKLLSLGNQLHQWQVSCTGAGTSILLGTSVPNTAKILAKGLRVQKFKLSSVYYDLSYNNGKNMTTKAKSKKNDIREERSLGVTRNIIFSKSDFLSASGQQIHLYCRRHPRADLPKVSRWEAGIVCQCSSRKLLNVCMRFWSPYQLINRITKDENDGYSRVLLRKTGRYNKLQ